MEIGLRPRTQVVVGSPNEPDSAADNSKRTFLRAAGLLIAGAFPKYAQTRARKF